MSFIIKNISGGVVEIDDIGIYIETAEELDIIENSASDVATSADLVAAVQSGDLIALDPLDNVTPLTIDQSVAAILAFNDTHFRIRGGELDQLDDVNLAGAIDNYVLTYTAGSPPMWTAQPATGGGSGEANTASNLTGDQGWFAQKVGADLQFKSITAGSLISLTPSATDITVAVDEASIDHTNILNIGTNTHAQIDSHISDATIHFTEGSISHTNILDIGTNTHAQIDSHIGDASIHFTEASIDHTNILNIGTNTHADIDTHIGNGTIHFTEASISHTNILDIGTNTHVQIDSHIADATLHFTEASISHTNIQDIGTNTHADIDTHLGDGTIHFTEGSISHTNILDIGTNTHAQIDTHIGDTDIHFNDAPADGSEYVRIDNTWANPVSGPTSEATIHDTIWAEENSGLNNNSREWSFGNGSTGTNNVYAMYDGEIPKMFLQAETEGTSVTVSVMINDVIADTGSWTANGVYTFPTPIPVVEGDAIGFRTGTVNGTWSDVRVGVLLDSIVVGLIGPQGDDGADGIDGVDGADGADGVGVPTGGTTGQHLAKIDGTDYNTTWVTPVDNDTTDHTLLTNIGTNTHVQIDTHIADSTIHFTEASIDHVNILNVGTNTHAQIDTHIGDASIHFTEASIDHTNILNIGTNSHADIDTHIADSTIHFTEASISHLNIQDIGINTHAQIDSHISDSTIHFTEGSIDHTNILNVGTNTHAQIDSHISDATIHFTEGSISHTNIQDIGTNTHVQIDTHIGDSSIHFTEASIDHTNILNIGTNSHAAIDSHIADATLHFTEGSISHTNIQDIGTNTHAQIDTHIADTTNPHDTSLENLIDTTITAVADGEVLIYNGTSGVWENVVLAVGGSGRIVQVQFGPIPAISSTASIPDDNTAPLITEGVEIWSQSITPQYIDSDFRLNTSFTFDQSANNTELIIAFFRGSTCIGTGIATGTTKRFSTQVSITVYDDPATLSSVTYSCRVGKTSGSTWYINRTRNSATALGGTLESQAYTVEEIGQT